MHMGIIQDDGCSMDPDPDADPGGLEGEEDQC